MKRIMGEKKLLSDEDVNQGISIDVTYLKQAEHLLRTANYQSAIKYTFKALDLNPESKEALTLLAKIYMLTNDWGNATEAAEMVLQIDKRSTKARLVKAEGLFNVCRFEHAMVHFHRGMVKLIHYPDYPTTHTKNTLIKALALKSLTRHILPVSKEFLRCNG